MIDNLGYRKNIGIILCNDKKQLLMFKRINSEAWQFPQGGINKNETFKDAMFRELREETGLSTEDVIIMGRTRKWMSYKLPKKFQRMSDGKTCIGQKQIWYLLKMANTDEKINFSYSEKPEFDKWKWVNMSQPPNIVIYFKKKVYKLALKELMPKIHSTIKTT